MNYISTKQASIKWGITQNRVFILAKNGQIPNVVQVGSRWLIPENAEKPLDGRTKACKIKKDNDFFRYPNFVFKDISSFYPPLSNEELQLKGAIEKFLACDFKEATKLLADLPEKATNIYVKIYALYIDCMIDMETCNVSRFFNKYTKLSLELQKDFPHKIEMSFLLHEIDALLGYNKFFNEEFSVDTFYDYHKSFLSHLAEMCAVSLYLNKEKATTLDIKTLEMACKVLEKTTDYIEIQSTYVYLGSTYAILGETDKTTFYFKKALDIAQKYNCFYCVLSQFSIIKQMFEPALTSFSNEFKDKLETLANNSHDSFIRFSNAISSNSIYKLLPNKYNIFIIYAVNGYSNKEIADFLQVSESTVNKEYSVIYDLTNVKNKIELIDLYNNSVNTSILNK